MRNEGVYALEWLAYHQSLGIDEFFIYSNNNDEGSDALLKRLSGAGVIPVCPVVWERWRREASPIPILGTNRRC